MKDKRKIASGIGIDCYSAASLCCKLFNKKSTEADFEKYLPEIQSQLCEALAGVLAIKKLRKNQETQK